MVYLKLGKPIIQPISLKEKLIILKTFLEQNPDGNIADGLEKAAAKLKNPEKLSCGNTASENPDLQDLRSKLNMKLPGLQTKVRPADDNSSCSGSSHSLIHFF